MAKHWRIHPHDPDRIAALERSAGVSAIVAQLLLCRGIDTPDAAKQFLKPGLSGLRDPRELPGIAEAVEAVFQAVENRQRIVVYGDYDADGMTGTAILCRCLRRLGAVVDFYVPHRIDEGYGLNDEALRTIAQQGTSLVITVDCGIASLPEAEMARQLGLRLIVTDHHAPAARLPDAEVIVHPGLPDSEYPFPGLCGAGVAFKLAWALCQRACGGGRVRPALRDFLVEAVGLAAIGTVADVVPLVDENRALVHAALAQSLRKQCNLGLTALMKTTGLDRKKQLSADDVAFVLAPRLNAAGRLGQAELAVELLLTEDAARAAELAGYIDEMNGRRQHLERSIYLAASKQAQAQFNPEADLALVLAERGWHPGVIGVVAGRLAEKYHRPVVLIAWDELGVQPGTGSGRTACGLNLHRALAACGEHLVQHGGHAAAAGLRIEDSRINDFRRAFVDYAAAHISQEDRQAEIWIDAETVLGALTLRTVEQIERLGPFGTSNPRPLLCASGVNVAERPRRIGSNERHLSVRLAQHDVALRAVAFGNGDWAEQLERVDQPLDVVFRPVVNHFAGRRSVELHLYDWRVQEEAALAEERVSLGTAAG